MGNASKYLGLYASENYKTWRFNLISSLGDVLLDVNPVNWDEVGLTLERDLDYGGVFRTYSAELEFVKNGYSTLKELEQTDGILAECELEMSKRDPITGKDANVFNSKIDFSEYKELASNGEAVSVTLSDSTFQEKLKNRENTDIPYDRGRDLDGNVMPVGKYIDMEILGRPFGNKGHGAIYKQVDPPDDINIYQLGDNNIGAYILNVDFGEVQLLPNFQNVNKIGLSNFGSITKTNAIYYSDVTSAELNVNFKYNLISTGNNTDYLRFDKIKFKLDGSIDYIVEEIFPPKLINVSGVYEGFVILEPYEGIVAYINHVSTQGATTVTVQEETNITARDISIFAPVDRKVALPYEVFSHVCHAITGEADSFRSSYFGRVDLGYEQDGAGAYISLTNGMLLRGFPTGYIEEEDDDGNAQKVAKLTFKLKDLFESYSKLKNLKLQIIREDDKNIISIEPSSYIYSETIGHTVESSNLEYETFERHRDIDMFKSGVKVGYVTNKDDELGGLEEYISSASYSNILGNLDNEYDLISPYTASTVPFERTRRKPFDVTSTEESVYDNQIFFFEIWNEDGELVQRDEQGFYSVGGLKYLDPKLNLGLTPKQMLLAHGDVLNVGLSQYPASKLLYNSADKTTDLSYSYDGNPTVIIENGDEVAGNLINPRFTGFKLVFSAPLGFEDFIKLRENPNVLIKVWSPLAKDYVYGWILRVSTDAVDTNTNWELIEANPPNIGNITLLEVNNSVLQLDDESLLRLT